MRASRTGIVLLSILALSACTASVTQENGADPAASASLVIQGSDTEVQMVSNLVERFREVEPDTDVSVTGGGSAVGIAALINGETDIANSSRQMKEEEMQQAAERGMDVQEFILARDGLAVVVHPSNAVKQLTVEQIGAIYAGTVTNWADVGGTEAPIVLYGRQSTSGTFGFFRDAVVKTDYAASMRQMEGTQAIVDAVSADTNGIGYVGVGYVKEADEQARGAIGVLLVTGEGGAGVSPLDRDAVLSGKYPIARQIYQYLPGVPAAGSVAERFLRFEASPEGQEIIEASGFYPLTTQDQATNALLFEAIQ